MAIQTLFELEDTCDIIKLKLDNIVEYATESEYDSVRTNMQELQVEIAQLQDYVNSLPTLDNTEKE